MSTRAFEPISEAGSCQQTLRRAAPVAVRRERGVDLGRYHKSELQAYVAADPGEAALHVRAQIVERRGGVLPHNWVVLEDYKANVNLMAQIGLKGRSVAP